MNLVASTRRAAAGALRTLAAIVLGFALALGVAAVPDPTGWLVRPAWSAPDRLDVITTTEDLAAIVREVGGDRVRVAALAQGWQDPHFLDAKPSYMVQLRRADAFVAIGLDLEVAWAPGILNGARNRNILPGAPGYVEAHRLVQVLEIPGAAHRAHGDVHPHGNPHYWLDPRNGAGIARAIRDGLGRVSPGDAAHFAARTADFEKRLAAATARWTARAQELGLPGMKVVTYHRSWTYFARAFGLDVVNFVEPRPGIPPSPNHVTALVAQMKAQQVKLLIMEPFFDPRLPRKIAADTGVPLVILPTSVGAEPTIRTWFDLFDHQLAAIAKALGRAP
jgi:zinc/manganese transport system substrate-binding protein